jgi:hypothetical protein
LGGKTGPTLSFPRFVKKSLLDDAMHGDDDRGVEDEIEIDVLVGVFE